MPNNQKLVCSRAARKEFSGAFRRGVSDYRLARTAAATCGRMLLERLPCRLPLVPLEYLYDEGVAHMAWDGIVARANADARRRGASFEVMARKRPLQADELESGEFDSLSVEAGNNAAVVHDGRVHRDGRTLYMVHSRFCLDRVFGESEGNDVVYADAAKPLVESAVAGGRSTMVLFGQTGTGKTHTARGVLDRLVPDLFKELSEVSLTCYELAGTRGGKEGFYDLLAERATVKCLTGEDGNVHVRGARIMCCRSPQELHEAIESGLAWRSSEVTERNESSSRSHAVIELRLSAPPGQVEGSGGMIRVVDLAGSERNYETKNHTRSMAERGGLINYSLLMLKECARMMHKNQVLCDDGRAAEAQHVPFRSSKLTHLLQSCFTDEAHRTVVVATLSPAPTDVEHSLNSLQHVGMMRASRSGASGAAALSAAACSADATASGSASGSAAAGFSEVQGRGHGLHSKLQDARAGQMRLRAFDMVTAVGGTIMKKYEQENVKTEAFIDPRYHREMHVQADTDLWVLREADEEVVQVLVAWQQEQWQARKAHDLSRWDAKAVQIFIRSLELPGEARIPSSMTGMQLKRLGRRGLSTLCSNEETAEAVHDALVGERQADNDLSSMHSKSRAKMSALGSNKSYVTLGAPAPTSAAAPAAASEEVVPGPTAVGGA